MATGNNAYPKMAKMRKDPKSLEDALKAANFVEASRRIERNAAKRADRNKSTRPPNDKRLDRVKEQVQAFSGKSQYDLELAHKWSGDKLRAYLMLLCVKYGVDTDLSKATKSGPFAVKQSREFVDSMAQHFGLSRKETLLAIEQWFASWENFCEQVSKAKKVGFYPGYWIKALSTLARHYPFNVLHQGQKKPTETDAKPQMNFDSMKLSNLFKPKETNEGGKEN